MNVDRWRSRRCLGRAILVILKLFANCTFASHHDSIAHLEMARMESEFQQVVHRDMLRFSQTLAEKLAQIENEPVPPSPISAVSLE